MKQTNYQKLYKKFKKERTQLFEEMSKFSQALQSNEILLAYLVKNKLKGNVKIDVKALEDSKSVKLMRKYDKKTNKLELFVDSGKKTTSPTAGIKK